MQKLGMHRDGYVRPPTVWSGRKVVVMNVSSKSKVQGDEELKELEINNRRNQLMLVNLSQLEHDTITYKNVGKAYVLAPKSEIISSYEESYAEGLAALKKRKADKEVVDKSVGSCLAELREHLEANESLARAVLQQTQGA